MNITYIHGNGATSDSFHFIRSQLSEHNEILIDYDSNQSFSTNYEKILNTLKEVSDIFFVAHSIGGIYALHLANALPQQVLGAVTLSTPYGGSKEAEMAQFLFPFASVLQDIQPNSVPIAGGNAISIQHPWVNLVSLDGGSFLMAKGNDGVVTQDSMRHRKDIELVDVDSSHYEILNNDAAMQVIKDAVKAAEAVLHVAATRRGVHPRP